jgi:hypothetical protein
MNFGNAPTDQGGLGELIPDKTLCWAIIKVRPHNLDHGMILVPSKSSDNKYLDVELTILEGPYARRKIWDFIGYSGKSTGFVSRGWASFRHIVEVGREITDNFVDGNPKYDLTDGQTGLGETPLMKLDGMRCAIMVGIQPGNEQYPNEKNTVRAYLSPNPKSDTYKNFMRLVNGDTAAPAPLASIAPATKASAAPAWAQPTAKLSPVAAQPTPNARPTWLGAKAAPQHDDVPF